MTDLELWGGHECTVNRVGDRFVDQTRLSGHHDRIDDLALFAGLGVKALRYPLVWERVAPERPDRQDWSWTDARLAEIQRLGLRPIAGLLHHGSGPAYTSLTADSFVGGLADFADAAARRYPWIEDWTPVNEPLTTARFSALYGHWYPHATDEHLFWLAFLNQIDGIRAAMKRIRAVNPAARLIQTEDLGQTYATPALGEQAAFENHRRWLTWDLLNGQVTHDHPFWARFARFGLIDRIKAITDDPCPPDIIGVNHYLTSERLLDDRTSLYPPHLHGGNDYIPYVDIEAVRVMSPGPAGLAGLLEQTWARYGQPIAITESHNGCTREEQMRWTYESWRTAQRLRARGVDIRALTAWALLGSYDWNSLLTQPAGHYEPGAFDMRAGRPRATGMTQMLRALARDEPVHPVARAPGWWRRDVRLEYRPVSRLASPLPPPRHWEPEAGANPPILITGATGTLGQALARICRLRGLGYVLTDRGQLALEDKGSIDAVLALHEPWAVVNAAGWASVDGAELDPAACHAVNTAGAANLAMACAGLDIAYVGVTSDQVFDGAADRPYLENHAPRPLNRFGHEQIEAEKRCLQAGAKTLIIRTAALFSADDDSSFAAGIARFLSGGRPAPAPLDGVVSPTYAPDFCNALLDLLIDGEAGLWHLTNGQAVSWTAFAGMIADALGLDSRLVKPVRASDLGWRAQRPAFSALASRHGVRLPTLDSALRRYAGAMADGAPAVSVHPSADMGAQVA